MNELTRRAPEIRDRASKRAPKVFLKPLAVLAYIEEYLSLNGGVSPSQDEIAHAFGHKKRGAATCRALSHLEVGGFIRRTRSHGVRRRDIEVIRPQRERIPVYRASDNKLMEYLP